jgi:hypothetical protein
LESGSRWTFQRALDDWAFIQRNHGTRRRWRRTPRVELARESVVRRLPAENEFVDNPDDEDGIGIARLGKIIKADNRLKDLFSSPEISNCGLEALC